MKNRAYKLLVTWCDALLSHQVRTGTPYTDNSLLCPACHVIHGRIADLCFPLTVIYSKSGNIEYLENADRLIDWSEYNLKTPEGLWYNDAGSRWYGISAFSAMSLGEAIYNFGEIIPEKYLKKWTSIFFRMVDVIAELDGVSTYLPPSNYFCGNAAVLAMALKLTGDVRYYKKARFWIDKALERFDEDGLLFGEGYPMTAADGSHTVDMGYNLEESLPLLLRYSELTGEFTEFFRDRLRDHLAFLLPDGAINNSFGTRHNKWTYWGSRTSDGLVEGLASVLDEPIFADACERILTLYERCTHNGLLAMPMAHEVNEPTCLHHTFTHTKALAALICSKAIPNVNKTVLPSEICYGTRKYQNGRLVLLSNGIFRATFSAIGAAMLPDYAANGGGIMNLLYHRDYGVICAATSAEYIPSEPLNQQHLRNSYDPPCMSAQFIINGEMACKDKGVKLKTHDMTVTAVADKWQADYTARENTFEIILVSDDGIYNLPIVCKKDSRITVSQDKKQLDIDEKLTIKSDIPLDVDPGLRIFSQVGGLLYLPISVTVHCKAHITLTASN